MAKANKRKSKQAAKAKAANPGRRAFLGHAKTIVIGGAAVGGAGWLLFDHFQAMAAEHDLSRIGKGAPKIVQIHDPQCPRCIALQREARAALGDCGEDAPCYLVANIRTRSGRDFAAAHRVGNVTLVLLDGDGQRVEILAGGRSREELSRRFKALARAA